MEKKRVFEIKTIKSIIIRSLFEVVKQYIKDTNIIFNSKGIKFSSVDTSENSYTFVELYADKFESYKCEREVVLGLNINVLFKVVKTANRKEIITMYANENEENFFYIELFDPFVDKKKTMRIDVLMLENEKDMDIDVLNFDSVISMSTSQFQQIIKDIHILDGKTVDIKSLDKRLIISCDDGIANFSTTMNELSGTNPDEDLHNSIKIKSGESSIIQGKFKLSYLMDFIKASHLCDTMNILLSNDKPLILEYFVADIGVLKLLLLPVN